MPFKKPNLFFALISILFVSPYLLLHGTNIVTHTYQFGARQIIQGLSPFVDPRGQGDMYKYGLLFGVFYYPFTLFNKNLQAFCWGLTNIGIFWFGVSKWVKPEKTSPFFLWIGFIACSMELDGSLRYQQMNAMIMGLSLIGMALYRDKSFFWAGFILTIATDFKLYPALFLFPLFFPFKKNYIFGALAGAALAFLLPSAFLGWSKNLSLHLEWFSILKTNAEGTGMLDLATVLERYGYQNARVLFNYPIAIISLSILFVSRLYKPFFNWNIWISLGALTLLLISPRTESPTFVIAGPTYIFLTQAALEEDRFQKQASLLSISAGIFLVTLCMNDLWPRVFFNASFLHYANKTFGILILWFAALTLFIRRASLSKNIQSASYA